MKTSSSNTNTHTLPFQLTYHKRDNKALFETLTKEGFTHLQNYIPLYNLFFTLKKSNYENVTLNSNYYLTAVTTKLNDNIFEGTVKNVHGEHDEMRKVFFKYSPILDATKYLMGKYDLQDINLLNLPSFLEKETAHARTHECNNLSYVDSFFTYLTSQLLHAHQFVHGLDYYGSFLAKQNDFKINIYDEIEYLEQSTFFNKERGHLFSVPELLSKPKLVFHEMVTDGEIDEFGKKELELALGAILLENENTNVTNSSLFELEEVQLNLDEDSPDTAAIIPMIKERSDRSSFGGSLSGSACSSRSSNTTVYGEDDLDEDDSDDDDDDDDNLDKDTKTKSNDVDIDDGINLDDIVVEDTDEENEEDHNDDDGGAVPFLFAHINNFPIQMIALEYCEGTLDSLLDDYNEDNEPKIDDAQLASVVIQILMILTAYQKSFDLTHNDLHTNNIMYINTTEEFLYYRFDDAVYKVPTYGRIYKIIDYGRAIYRFRGKLLCSDSFHSDGDAATQYNFEPFYNSGKPRIEPNPSFDLSRLGCALYDFVDDDDEDDDDDDDDDERKFPKPKKVISPIKEIIKAWCLDDKGRNVLYKNSGEERYPEFKLYKMIARTVHDHIPKKVIKKPFFNQFVLKRKQLKNLDLTKVNVMDIDALPNYQ